MGVLPTIEDSQTSWLSPARRLTCRDAEFWRVGRAVVDVVSPLREMGRGSDKRCRPPSGH